MRWALAIGLAVAGLASQSRATDINARASGFDDGFSAAEQCSDLDAHPSRDECFSKAEAINPKSASYITGVRLRAWQIWIDGMVVCKIKFPNGECDYPSTKAHYAFIELRSSLLESKISYEELKQHSTNKREFATMWKTFMKDTSQ